MRKCKRSLSILQPMNLEHQFSQYLGLHEYIKSKTKDKEQIELLDISN